MLYLQASGGTDGSGCGLTNSTGIYTNDQSLTRHFSNKSLEWSIEWSKDNPYNSSALSQETWLQ